MLRFKTNEELLASGWTRMNEEEADDLSSTNGNEECFKYPGAYFAFISSMRSLKFKQEDLSNAFNMGTFYANSGMGVWTISREMLIEELDPSAHTCVPVNVSAFFVTMACKVCGRDM